MTPLPTFLLIGAARAGTTSLHQWLAQHPDVCMSRPKETQFFSLHANRSPAAYQPFFQHYAGEPAVGESTPVYLSLPYVPARIAALLPDVRLVAILREPVAQAYSTWWMFRSVGTERRSFEAAVTDELQRGVPDVDEGFWARWHGAALRGRPLSESRYLATGRYADAVRRYREHFDARQLTFLFHDDLTRDPASVVRRLAAAAGVDPARAPSPSPPRSNSARGRAETWTRRRLRHVPSSLVRRLAAQVARSAGRSGPPPLDPRLRGQLTRYFADANRGLEELVGRDCSGWFAHVTADHG